MHRSERAGKPVHAPDQLWAAELHILNESVQLKKNLQYVLREADVSLMSSDRADKIVNTLHTASIILQYSMSAQLGKIYTKHVQSRVVIVREGFHCFVQILLNSDLCDLMRFEL